MNAHLHPLIGAIVNVFAAIAIPVEQPRSLTLYSVPCDHGVSGPCSLCKGACPCCGSPDSIECAHQPVTLKGGTTDQCFLCWARMPGDEPEPEPYRYEPDWDMIFKEDHIDA